MFKPLNVSEGDLNNLSNNYNKYEESNHMDTLNQEIIALIKRLPKAESETPSVHGLTELELTCGKILDRLLIASGHGRPPIRIQIGDKQVESM